MNAGILLSLAGSVLGVTFTAIFVIARFRSTFPTETQRYNIALLVSTTVMVGGVVGILHAF